MVIEIQAPRKEITIEMAIEILSSFFDDQDFGNFLIWFFFF
jgi:hypothetical protein